VDCDDLAMSIVPAIDPAEPVCVGISKLHVGADESSSELVVDGVVIHETCCKALICSLSIGRSVQ